MPQAVSHLSVNVETRTRTQTRPCGFYRAQNETGVFSLRELQFSNQYIFLPLIYYLQYITLSTDAFVTFLKEESLYFHDFGSVLKYRSRTLLKDAEKALFY